MNIFITQCFITKLPFQRTRPTIYVAIRNVQFSKEVSTGMACLKGRFNISTSIGQKDEVLCLAMPSLRKSCHQGTFDQSCSINQQQLVRVLTEIRRGSVWLCHWIKVNLLTVLRLSVLICEMVICIWLGYKENRIGIG